MKTETFKSNDPRRIHAHQTVTDYGARYLNPLIGNSASETCANTENVMSLLHELFIKDFVGSDMNPGLAKIIQTVWSAMQHERNVANLQKEESA